MRKEYQKPRIAALIASEEEALMLVISTGQGENDGDAGAKGFYEDDYQRPGDSQSAVSPSIWEE